MEGWERGAVAASYDLLQVATFLYRTEKSLLQHVGFSRNRPYTVCACLNIKYKLQTCNLVTWRTIIFDLAIHFAAPQNIEYSILHAQIITFVKNLFSWKMRALYVIQKKTRHTVNDIRGHIQEKTQPVKEIIQIFEAVNDFAGYHDCKR